MSGFEGEDKSVQRSAAPSATAATGQGASPEGGMHETRKNVTRHRRAAMRKEGGKGAAGSQVDIPEGGGAPLSGGVKSTMEKKLGANLSDVKIHTGGDSANASEKLNAQAFTVGNDVHFNSGKFDPGSKEGTKLLAHELTHVVQGQKGGVQKKEDEGEEADAEGKDGEALEVSDPDEPAEKEADAVADKATEDMGDGGAAEAAGGDEKAAAGGEAEAAGGETEEQAPEAGAKLQSPISAKFSASALRKLLRKKAFRDPAAEEEEKKPDEAAGAEAEPEASSSEAAAEAPAPAPEAEEKVAAKLQRKVFRDPAAADEEKKEPEAAGEASSSEAASAEAEAPAEAAPPEAGGEEKQEVAAKLQRKVFRDPAAADEEKKEPEAAGEASSSEAASAEAEAPADAAPPEAGGEEKQEVAAKLQRKVFRDEAEEKPAEAPAAEAASAEGEAESKEGASAEAPTEEKKVAAKLKGVHRKVFRYAAEYAEYQGEYLRRMKEDVRGRAAGVADLGGLQTFLSGLPDDFADNKGQAAFRIGKLQTAMTESRAEFAKDPTTQADKQKKFIDDRLALLPSAIQKGLPKAIDTAQVESTGNIKKMDVGATMKMIVQQNFDIVAPEEEAEAGTLNAMGGVYKCFDAFAVWDKMNPDLKALWTKAHGEGAQAQWLQSVKAKKLPIEPTGGALTPTDNAALNQFKTRAKDPYNGGVSGFISEAKEAKKLTSYAQAKQLLSLDDAWYPSRTMIVGEMGAGGAQAAQDAGARIGKPSMFYLLMFPENVYVASNRTNGTTAGGERELQALNVPVSSFLDADLNVLV